MTRAGSSGRRCKAIRLPPCTDEAARVEAPASRRIKVRGLVAATVTAPQSREH
jgi:hypothetical protein